MSTIYVRVAHKTTEVFHRCGYRFTRAWRKLDDVDAATLRRLNEEQMLEVSETEPDGFEPTAAGEGSSLQAAPEGEDLVLAGNALQEALADLDRMSLKRNIAESRVNALETKNASLNSDIAKLEFRVAELASAHEALKAQLAPLPATPEKEQPQGEKAGSTQPVEGAAENVDSAAPAPEAPAVPAAKPTKKAGK